MKEFWKNGLSRKEQGTKSRKGRWPSIIGGCPEEEDVTAHKEVLGSNERRKKLFSSFRKRFALHARAGGQGKGKREDSLAEKTACSPKAKAGKNGMCELLYRKKEGKGREKAQQ